MFDMAGTALIIITMNDLFSSSLNADVFSLMFLLWFLSEIVGSSIIPTMRNGGRILKKTERGTNLIIYGSVASSLLIAFLFAGFKIAMMPDWVFYPGIILMVLGILLRQWSIIVLGRFFSTSIGVQKGHKVVDSGPYRFIRHPSYLGAFITFLGIGVALGSWGAVITFLIMFILAYGYRIHIEEKFLVSELGDDYIQYMKRTKRLIPFLI